MAFIKNFNFSTFNLKYYDLEFYTSFVEQNTVVTNATTGSATLITISNFMSTIVALQTLTSATANPLWRTLQLAHYTAVQFERRLEFDWVTSIASSSTQRYTVRAGLMLTTGFRTDGTGIYFRYTDNVNSGNIQCVCRNGATETFFNTSIPGGGASATRHDMAIYIYNFLSTSVEFFINGVSQTIINTNLPPTNSALCIGAGMVKSIGTTNRLFGTDQVRSSISYPNGTRF